MADVDLAALCRQMAIARQRRIDSEAEEALLQAQIAAAGRPRRFANEPNVEDLVVPPPPDPLVVSEFLARNAVVSVLSTPVSRFGLDPVLLDGYFNFDQHDMARIVANKGVFVVTSLPQSDKTCCLGAGIAAQQKVVSRPQILMFDRKAVSNGREKGGVIIDGAKRGSVHKVLHCKSSKCAFGRQGATWNRDVNAGSSWFRKTRGI
jgi:hypothetical protein